VFANRIVLQNYLAPIEEQFKRVIRRRFSFFFGDVLQICKHPGRRRSIMNVMQVTDFAYIFSLFWFYQE